MRGEGRGGAGGDATSVFALLLFVRIDFTFSNECMSENFSDAN